MKKYLGSGDWGHSIYKAYSNYGGNIPKGHITGVFAICLNSNGNIILKNDEPVGGHIEPGETIEIALKRELVEEIGFDLKSCEYFGYYLIIQKDDAPNKFKLKYPKKSYIVFFIVKGEFNKNYTPEPGNIFKYNLQDIKEAYSRKHLIVNCFINSYI